MKISTKGRYAVRMLVDIAAHQGDGYVSLRDVAQRQGISKKYLEQIVALLHQPALLQTNRGNQGGYRLAQPADSYTLGSILRLTEGSLAPVACLEQDAAPCERAEGCVTLPVWQGLADVISAYLDGITLQDLLDRQQETRSDYYVI